jgi:hypothetical protein
MSRAPLIGIGFPETFDAVQDNYVARHESPANVEFSITVSGRREGKQKTGFTLSRSRFSIES